MTIDEAISHEERNVEINKLIGEVSDCEPTNAIDYHRQLVEWLKELKQLREQTEWIPVSESLPEKDENVLLTICANNALYGFNENFVEVMCGSYSPCEDKRDWIVNGIRYYIDNIIAWTPLPEPYRQKVRVQECLQ